MKIKPFFLLALCVLTAQSHAQFRADRQKLDDPESFSMILMGDPQSYLKFDVNQGILDLTTAWTVDNIKPLNIKAVLITGDIVEANETTVPNRRISNQTSKQMWEFASRTFSRFDNKLPYIISLGNHDYGYNNSDNDFTHFPEYFPIERNSAWDKVVVETYPGRNGISSLENAAYEFNDSKWGKLLVIATEFVPRDEVIEWIKDLCGKKYKDHRVILLTHLFIDENNYRIENQKYNISGQNQGQKLWDKLVKVTPNIRCVICGHAGEPGDFDKSVGYREDKNDAGITVPQMMFNVQVLGGGWEGNGGDGWLRILEFKPDGKTVGVKTYSPLFGISPTTKKFAHRTAACDQFDMILAK